MAFVTDEYGAKYNKDKILKIEHDREWFGKKRKYLRVYMDNADSWTHGERFCVYEDHPSYKELLML